MPDPQIPEHLDDLYWRATSIRNAAESEAFRQAVRRRNPELADQLDRLLASRRQADQRFEGGVNPDVESGGESTSGETARGHITGVTTGAAVGSILGRYRLLEVVGEGGMGVVFRAEQVEPVRRIVAVKVIRPGMGSHHFIARFDTERQTLAMMDHPNIARVLDAGATDGGLPYFAMEYVDGVPITEFARWRGLSLRQRLQLIQQACAAIQHAHHKGVIHRDLKSTNLLVTEQDGDPVVKVIDFGIAKALREGLREDTLHSAMSPVLGTLLYMSPEQAGERSQTVDTRSDVYSLGVVLYELLSGTTPIGRDPNSSRPPEEIRRQIRESIPPRPSRRIRAQLDDAGPSAWVADPLAAELARQCRGEMDWVVMTALEKDPARRYQSPRDLHDDIQRYLDGYPVQARPPSTWYRLSKWASRHRLGLTAATAVVLAILVGAGVAGWEAARAIRAERAARESLAIKTQRELELRRLLYASDMEAAADAALRGDIPAMRARLAAHRPSAPSDPDFRGFEWWHYWNRTARDATVVFQGDDGIRSIALNPSRTRLAAGDDDGMIRLFRLSDFKPIREFASDQIEAWDLAFFDDRQLVCGGADGTVAVYDVATGGSLDSYRVADTRQVGIAVTETPRGVVVAGSTGQVQWIGWDGEAFSDGEDAVREFPRRLAGRVERIAVAASPAEPDTDPSAARRTVLAGGHGGHFAIHDFATASVLLDETETAGMGPTRGLAASPDGRLAARAQGNGLLSLYQLQPTVELLFRTLLPGDLHSVAFDDGGRMVYAGDVGGYVHEIPLTLDPYAMFMQMGPSLRQRMRSWKLHKRKVDAIRYAPGRQLLLTGGRDGKLLAVRVGDDTTRRNLPIEASDLAFGPAGNLFVTDGMLKRVPPPHRTAPQPGPALPPSGSPTSDEAGQWKELEVADRAGVVVAERHGEQLASWPLDYSAAPEVIWRRPDGEWLIHWRVTRDGRRLIANLERQDSRSHRLTCVDLETGRERYSLPCNLIYAMAISPDERWFAFSRNDDVEVIDLETGELLRRLPGHTTSIREIGFSPDGRFLASVSDDRTVRCWRFPEGELAWSAMAHDNRATALAFHPDGETLATAGADSIVRFWRHQSGHAVGRIPVSGGFIKDIEFDPGGETLAVVHARADVVLLHARRNNQ